MIGCHISQLYPDLPPVVQIYTHSTKPYRQYDYIEQMAADLATQGIKFYVHSTFNCVPAGANFKFFMGQQFRFACKIKAEGLVVHIPNRPSVSEIIESFNIGLASKKTKVFLEHIPGKYADPKMLEVVYESLTKSYPDVGFGICIDTCHIYVSGYDLSDQAIMEKYIEQVKAIGCPVLVHLNDSMGDLGSKLDRHDVVGSKIWSKENFGSLKILLDQGWDCIMEIDYEQKFGKGKEFLNYIYGVVADNK